MSFRSRDLLFAAALIAGVVILFALQRSREHAPVPVTKAPVAVKPASGRERALVPVVEAPAAVTPASGPLREHVRARDRYRQIGLPAPEPMLLYFPPEPDRRFVPRFDDLRLQNLMRVAPKKL